MNSVLPLLGEPWVQRLGWVLIHFLWQGTLIAILLGVFLRLASGLSSQARYLVIAASLGLCGVAPFLTWSVLGSSPVAAVAAPAPFGSPLPVPMSSPEDAEPAVSATMAPTRGLSPVTMAWPSLSSRLSAATPYVVVAWFVGSLLFSLRLAYGWLSVLRIRRSAEALQDPEILAIFRRQMEMFSISGPVRLVQSVAVEVPTLIGWLRPVILLPVSVVTGLSRDHLEAILAHELAHVRRWDYAVNFLQSVVEVALFYHPAVWWISGRLREEREHCCDDLAIRVLQDRFTYASALASLEECRAAALTLTASGSLLQRIRRIAGVREARASVWPLCLAVVIVVVGLSRFAMAASPEPAAEIKVSAQDFPPSQKELNRDLLAASMRGDLGEVNRLLDLGAEPTVNGDTLYDNAFFAAAATNHPEIVRVFLARGVDPNTRNASKVRAIEWVLDQGNLPMATLLKDAGATMDPIRWAGATGDNAALESLLATDPKPDRFNRAFRYAVSTGRLDTVKLIERLSGKPIPGSLLTQAATAGQIAMMEYILAQGADVQKDGEKAIDRTVLFFNQPEAVRLLLKRGIDPNRISAWGEHLLSSAQTAATVKVLLEAGADPNVAGRDTPLSAAPDAESVRLLIQYGADPKRSVKDGSDLIELATAALHPDRPDVIEELIRQGAPFDPKGNGVEALSRATFFDLVGQARVLLDHGVDPNGYTEFGGEVRSILTSAAYQASPEMVKMLLDRGADPLGLPNESLSPLNAAVTSGNTAVVALLQKYGANNVPPLCIAAAAGDAERVKELLAAGANIDDQTSGGNSPLLYSLRRGHPEIARLLLQAGANPNLFNRAGMNADVYMRLFASPDQPKRQWQVSKEEAERRLSALKAVFAEYPLDPKYQDERGWTFLHQAAWAAGFFAPLGKKIDPNIRDNEGRPPLLLVALSPKASNIEELITTAAKPQTPEDKGTRWNNSAHVASVLLQLGADPDLPMPNGETVRSLALAAAEKAGNAQLVTVLKEAKKKEVAGQ